MVNFVFLNDKATLFMEGLIATTQVLECNSIKASLDELTELNVEDTNILMIDLDSSGTSIFKKIKQIDNKPFHILTFAHNYDETLLDFLVYHNVKAILTKDISIELLSGCVESIINEEPYVHPKLSKYLLASYKRKHPHHIQSVFSKKEPSIQLSEREVQIANLLCKGKTDNEISEILNISPTTVRNHIQNGYKKTNTRTRVQLLVFCLKNEWISID